MKRSWPIWISFALCLAAGVAAMAWVSVTAVRLDRAEAEARQQAEESRHQADEARRQADLEGRIRLALWRADSTLAPVVVQESVLPWFAYRSFLPADRAYARMFNERGSGEMLVPSPLLTANAPYVLVHFQFEPDGQLTSPQVPTGTNRKLAVARHLQEDAIRQAQARVERVRTLVDRKKLAALLPAHTPEPVQVVMSPQNQQTQALQPAGQQAKPQQQLTQGTDNQASLSQSPLNLSPQQRQMARNRREEMQRVNQQDAAELDVRRSVLGNAEQFTNTNNYGGNTIANNSFALWNGAVFPSTDMSGVPMTPLWIDGQLILARHVSAGGSQYVQGCLLDWPALKAALVDMVADLLPQAEFQPASSAGSQESEGRLLAVLPIRLVPGKQASDAPIASLDQRTLSPIVLALAIGWACMVLAAAAVAGLLAGVMRLSERRASFVNAVTHELRTPLTTFQMYAEMLAEGMVQDDQQQRHYLNTLRAEAVRLTHMVENVLSYARLERGRADGRLESVSLGQLADRVKERLSGRAEQADMELVLEGDDSARGAAVRANVSAVEQILFNLVDNACKYAACADDKRIHLAVIADNRRVGISVRDHGPGLAPPARRRLFRSFSKSAQEAAHSAPGIGLGLALSRRLARHMGGDLQCEERGAEGTCFTLVLASDSG